MRRGPRLLVVAGHDPQGGAGLDADREAARRFAVPLACVVTAETDQEGGRVRSIGARPAAIWLREARAALAPPPLGLKSGLLPGAEHVRALATLVRALGEGERRPPVVVDPVLAASSGEAFLDAAGERALRDELLPLGLAWTPNLPEAARLLGLDPERLAGSAAARIDACRALLEAGARAVVLKGGHAADDPVRDLVCERGAEPRWCEHPRVPGGALRGSGCRFATALAAGLVRGASLADAAQAAGRWLGERIAAAADAPRAGS